ncbi:hypothetical protein [Christiangramia sp.]|uniref:hypothetical protein n=1 Tax=Christiangramia sp. TaxID=1931228 RepID=UPI002637BB48|nr:hypothetical protein [Christiangramia sp.]
MEKLLNYQRKLTEKEPGSNYSHQPLDEEFEENEITEIPPELYSKRVITAFCILFSTIFGAVILMSNLKKKDEQKGKLQVLFFSIIYTAGMIFTVAYTKSSNFTILLNILGAIILNEYFWNRYLGKDIEFEKKSWVKPALISITVTIPFIIALLYA